jgi:hypothetical protein
MEELASMAKISQLRAYLLLHHGGAGIVRLNDTFPYTCQGD